MTPPAQKPAEHTIFVGIDDTDVIGTPGTGHLARAIAERVTNEGAVCAVSRHQLLVHPDVPMTKNNSANVLHVTGWPGSAADLLELARRMVADRAAEGSDPAVCMGIDVPRAVQLFGGRAQREVLSPADARALAGEHGIALVQVSDTDDGLVGALAGVGLASTGNDGRFVSIARVRELAGRVSVEQVLRAGITSVRLLDGSPLTDGLVSTEGKVRPSIVDGQPVLFVEPAADGAFTPLRLDKPPATGAARD